MKLHQSVRGCVTYLTAVCSNVRKGAPLRAVDHVDLDRYAGAWRIVACVGNRVERDFVDAVETYERRTDGNIDVTFCWREKSFRSPLKMHAFIGWVTDPPSNAHWKMRLVPFLSATQVVIGLGPDYDWVALAHPTREFGWVLARDRALPDETYRAILGLFAEQGYDPRTFIKVPQMVLSPAAAAEAVH